MKRLVTCVLIVFAVLMAFPLVRTVLRYRAVNMALRFPEARQRVSVIPTHRTFPEPSEHIQNIDLGYATFDIGFTDNVSRSVFGKTGTRVILSNATVVVWFGPPTATERLYHASQHTRDELVISRWRAEYPKSVSQLQEMISNPLQAQIHAENTTVASLWELALMTEDQFRLYTMHLIQKLATTIGMNEVISFDAPYSRGLIRIGENPTDRTRASVWLLSQNNRCMVACNARMTKSADYDIGALMESIARSYRFSVETVPSFEKVEQLMEQAGIRGEETRGTEGGTEGARLDHRQMKLLKFDDGY
jgi:hypothetical protein